MFTAKHSLNSVSGYVDLYFLFIFKLFLFKSWWFIYVKSSF